MRRQDSLKALTDYHPSTGDEVQFIRECDQKTFIDQIEEGIARQLNQFMTELRACVSGLACQPPAHLHSMLGSSRVDGYGSTPIGPGVTDLRTILSRLIICNDQGDFSVKEVSSVLLHLKKKGSEYTVRNLWCARGLIDSASWFL